MKQSMQLMAECIKAVLPVEITQVTGSLEAQVRVHMQSFDLALVACRPGSDKGVKLIGNLVYVNPFLIVIGISKVAEPSMIRSVMRAGAAGFLLKTFTTEQLLRVIRLVFLGEEYYDAEIEKVLLAWQGKKR